jgi:flagellar motor switch protein FliG
MAAIAGLDDATRIAVLREVIQGARSNRSAQGAAAALPAPANAQDPFVALEKADIVQAVQALRGEHPQVIAAVLANRSSKWGAKVLAALDPQLASEVSFRIATIGRPSPRLMSHADRIFTERMSQVHKESDGGAATDGPRELASILNLAGKTLEEAVLAEIEEQDQALAHKVRGLMFVFDDLATLDDRDIQRILQSVEAPVLGLALKGASDEVRQKILGNLSERARSGILEEMDVMGAVRRQQVDEARANIISRVRALEAEGSVQIARSDEGDMIV